MKKLINEFRMLDSEEQAFFGYGALVLLGAMFLFWLTTTVTPPVVDHHTTDYQTYQKVKHELPQSYNKYANRIYNEKYGK
jgi:hypothetical protein